MTGEENQPQPTETTHAEKDIKVPFHLEPEEGLKMHIQPHFLSFIGYYFVPFMMILFGVLIAFLAQNYSDTIADSALGDVADALGADAADAANASWFVVWFILMILWGFIVSAMMVTKKPLIFIVLIAFGAIGIFGYNPSAFGDLDWILPAYGIAFGVVGLLLVEFYRNSFHYYITNYRIGFIRAWPFQYERLLRYPDITDVVLDQTFIGELLGFGTVIPVTKSGFGLGSDSSSVGVSAGASGDAGDGAKVGGGLSMSGTKEIREAKSIPKDSIFGVSKAKEVRDTVAHFIHENSPEVLARKQLAAQERLSQQLQHQSQQ